MLQALPHFGRQPFSMASVNGKEIGVNPFLDMVYCVPLRQGDSPIPVGVVSKNYRLVDHHQVLRTAEDALLENGVKLSSVKICGECTPSTGSEPDSRCYSLQKIGSGWRWGSKTKFVFE